jgi:hypothetical protein
MEPIIALVVTILLACAIGFARRGGRTLNGVDAEALGAKHDEYLRAVTAAGLVQLSHFVGDPPAVEDLEQSAQGPRLITEMTTLLEGQEPDAVVKGLGGLRAGKEPTVESFLAGLAADTAKYWS